MRPRIDTDREIATIAGRRHGVVARWQLLELALSEQSIKRRVRAGRLHRLHRGVYAVGHTVLRVEGRWMAATLATGGVLSDGSAAAAWDLRPLGGGAIHVTVQGGGRRCAGVRVHRTRSLAPHELASHRGIPITTPARTIIDLARTLKGRALEQALDRAEQPRLLDFNELRDRPIPPSLALPPGYHPPTHIGLSTDWISRKHGPRSDQAKQATLSGRCRTCRGSRRDESPDRGVVDPTPAREPPRWPVTRGGPRLPTWPRPTQ